MYKSLAKPAGMILIPLIFLFSGQFATAQSLQFSQVLKISSLQDTVPAGKTWKLESFWQSETIDDQSVEGGACTIPSRHHPFFIDNERYYQFSSSPGTGATGRYKAVGNGFPLWLPEGTTLRTICPGDFLSVIEFTIVP